MLVRSPSAGFLACVLALLPAVLGCGGAFSTPEACFQSMQRAGHNKDVAGMMQCLTDESQGILSGGLVLMGSAMKMASGFAALGGEQAAGQAADMEQLADEVDGVLAKHGVTEESLEGAAPTLQTATDSSAIRKLSDAISDKPRFIADMFAVLQKSQQGSEFSKEFEDQIAGTLKDVKIEGDSATATIVTANGEAPVEFRKTAVGWKLHIDLPGMGPGAAPPA
jgi:hypothetical protein